jgi:hypothetical protein
VSLSVCSLTYFGPFEAPHISCNGMTFIVNILHDISICFIALVYVNYLVFLRRLKHGGLWLSDLFLPTWWRHLFLRHLRLRRENGALKLCKRLSRGRLRAPLVLEVVGEDPRRLG